MATMTPIDIFNSLSDRQKQQVRASLNIHQSPCERNGHKYKSVAKIGRLFAPTQDKLVCTQCGKSIVV